MVDVVALGDAPHVLHPRLVARRPVARMPRAEEDDDVDDVPSDDDDSDFVDIAALSPADVTVPTMM